MSTLAWLPPRFDRATFSTITDLEQAAWTVYQKDFATPPKFRSENVGIVSRPHKARPDRGHTYWHMITEGEPEETRTHPMVDRLERLPWTRPVIENEGDTAAAIKVWANERHGNTHVCIWFDQQNYIVVLKQCASHYLLRTTYCPESKRRLQLHREYAAWKKSGARL